MKSQHIFHFKIFIIFLCMFHISFFPPPVQHTLVESLVIGCSCCCCYFYGPIINYLWPKQSMYVFNLLSHLCQLCVCVSMCHLLGCRIVSFFVLHLSVFFRLFVCHFSLVDLLYKLVSTFNILIIFFSLLLIWIENTLTKKVLSNFVFVQVFNSFSSL